MSEWIRTLLDLVLIGVVGAGLVQAARLIKHLAILKQGRIDMERFVHEFNATVIRAEVGIKGLRQAARDSGDDLEKLVEKAHAVRDELQFLVESADQVAERLSQRASTAQAASATPRPEAKAPESRPATAAKPVDAKATPASAAAADTSDKTKPSSRAEKELLQALQKLS